MAFEFCCFISYPHGQDDVLVPFVKNFVEGLEQEIKAITRKKVWTDYNFLKGGNKLDQTIGSNLCKSACMILIYTPLYFDTDHVYCARELQAMQKLEEQRLGAVDKSKGLIIPILLRGKHKFPQSIKEQRKFYEFDDILFNNPKKKLNVLYAGQIREIAEYIFDRCEELDEAAKNDAHDCEQYELPSPEEAKTFVATLLGKCMPEVPVPFVVRTDGIQVPAEAK